MTTSSPNLLCRSLDVTREQPIVLQKELMPGYRIGLRPVCICSDNDINAIHEWLSEGYPGRLPIDQLRVFFILLAESTYAQAFMVLLNGEMPIGQFEVYQVMQDELKDSIDAGEGDYRIYVPVIPVIEALPEITVQILRTCLFYFFSCAEVKRVFWVVPENDKERNKAAVKTGFKLHPQLNETNPDSGQGANIYQYSAVDFY
ncbi:GNAT family N-acetyltransferase [Niastella populi]|uniref:N-acetyltransferase domain-containing protein n=1 Tax=Niastella populi TaxID=550983 RepID=A0A1V9F3R3_9BACT|nr:GNAT family N-acetyltransferase [Niastella populi]OQP52917.1 hypothetical protein A4R26_28205 [Niastella populi]